MKSLIFAAAAALTLGTAATPAFAGGARQGGYNPDYLPAVETQQSSAAMVALGGGAHGPVETVNSLPVGFADHTPRLLARIWPQVDTQSASLALAPLGGGGRTAPVETVNTLPVGFADQTPRMLAAHIRDTWYASRAQRQNMAREGNVVPKG